MYAHDRQTIRQQFNPAERSQAAPQIIVLNQKHVRPEAPDLLKQRAPHHYRGGGDLSELRQTLGSFDQATDACLANDQTTNTIPFDQQPEPGQAIWFLLRMVQPDDPGTYDTQAGSQVGSRDPEIAVAAGACP